MIRPFSKCFCHAVVMTTGKGTNKVKERGYQIEDCSAGSSINIMQLQFSLYPISYECIEFMYGP